MLQFHLHPFKLQKKPKHSQDNSIFINSGTVALGQPGFPREDLLLERVSRDLLRNNKEVANQRRAMTMVTLSYLSTQEVLEIYQDGKSEFKELEAPDKF